MLHIVGRAYHIQYGLGDMVTFRSAIVMHEIMPVTRERSAVVLFSKGDAVKWTQTREQPSRPWAAEAEELETDLESECRVRARARASKDAPPAMAGKRRGCTA